MEYPESYMAAHTVAAELRSRLSDQSVDEVSLRRPEVELIVDLLDTMIKDAADRVRQTNSSQL